MAKSAIADAVLYLTRVAEKFRRAAECLNSPRFWISLAALSTLHSDHSKLLSSPVFMNGNSGRVIFPGIVYNFFDKIIENFWHEI